MNKKQLFYILFLVGLIKSYAFQVDYDSLEAKYPIIPTPQQIEYGSSETHFTAFAIENGDFDVESELLKSFLTVKGLSQDSEGIKIKFIHKEIAENTSDEAYTLSIDEGITITAKTSKGAFYAVQTLKQVFRQGNGHGIFPRLTITDWSAFKIRGLMHDTGRNFQSIAQLKEQIEVLAVYKYNIFHWHLTDNPAWRLASKIYPQLQNESTFTRGKGDFYTQEDFKELVTFAAAKHITIIPEFDIPGHTDAFRTAFGFETMRDKKVEPVLLDLFKELLSLTDATTTPYIHIGTDEVRNSYEYVDNELILNIMALLKKHDREVIVWEEGIRIKEDTTSIGQLWAQHPPRKGHRFIDSRANYVNHLDPFAGMSRLFFQQPTRQKTGDDEALGGILCVWPDDKVSEERNILKHNPVYPAIVFYADAIWKGRDKDYPEYWAKLPPVDSKEFKNFADFESKVIAHRDLFFKDKEFQYVKQTDIQWKVIGPFDHRGDLEWMFPVEDGIKNSYKIGDKLYKWSQNIAGATIHFKHFFGFPALTDKISGTYYAYTNIYSSEHKTQDFWIGFQGWSRSGGRRGGPFPDQGQWHTTNPKIWVNDEEIGPPVWKQPGLGTNTHEIPFIDEDYFYREPTKIDLKKGWNKVLIKIPHGGTSWKWMFTCVPVNIDVNGNVNEVLDLKFDPTLRTYSDYYYNKKEEFETEKDTEDEIIFLGNSITDGGKWKELFPTINAINQGISGDVTDGILNRIEAVTKLKPKKVFLLIGTNDLARGKTVNYVAEKIREIIEEIQVQSPSTIIYVQTILPVNLDVGNKFNGHKSNGDKIIQLNEKLKIITSKTNINYLNIHKPFSDKNGNLKAKYTHDGLHLNEKGYSFWKKRLKNHIN
ncbi:family 20 glycosylhydrolase [Aureibaculum conchae]|uniref:family 20 glycosylhydrolase n=1 Tax=Aureibaculum sp. 2308TA14-22 TaxID=3108392 RepID=UPI00339A0AFA